MGSSSSGKGAKLTQTEIDLMKQKQGMRQQKQSGVSFTLEEIYKMGYEDSSKNIEFGTSLPENHESFQFTQSYSSMNIDEKETFEYDDYEPTPPPLPPKQGSSGGGNKFGFGTLMSMFALFRSVKELGFNAEGRFDYPLFMANVQNVPPLKMAFMGFMLYRVVSAFL